MTIQFASAIVNQIGSCRIALETPGFPALRSELALLGCDTSGGAAKTVVIEWSESDPRPLRDKLAPYASADRLVILPNQSGSSTLEASVFAAGWRRHPGAVTAFVMAHLEQGRLPEACCYERAPDDYTGILNLRDEASLASIGRWVLASERVRAGDRVLLLGDNASDGRIIVEALSRASAVEVGKQGSDEHDDRGFDLVVAFDPPGTWATNIGRYTRCLKLDGRVILGWPDSSSNGPGNWEALESVLTDEFLIESRFAQPAGQAVPHPVPLADFYRPGWQIAVATMNPIGGEAERDSYVHPAFGRSAAPLVNFAGYDNPWLYRTMVQMGERLTDDTKLARLAEYVIKNARPGSADQGAAMAVLGYRVLESRADNAAPVLLGAIETYYAHGGDEPHVVRWRVSLAFLAGRLAELLGDREAARLWYGRAASDDWKRFSNILATKAIGAAFFAGRLSLAEGDPKAAWPWFQRGVDIALEAAGANHVAELGTGEGLLPFYLPELAEVIDMGSQCANALANRHLWARNPGLFWRQVDVKRFGLASWAIDVAKENARLRQMIARAA